MTTVINSLPYLISLSGNYILGSDFIWSDNTQSAITISNVSNVNLDFVGKKIQTNLASNFPVVYVTGSDNVILTNNYIEAISSAINNSAGIKIFQSEKVTVKSATLLNLDISFYVEEVKKLKVEKMILKNTISSVSISVFIYNSRHVKFYDSEIVNGRCLIRSCKNVDVYKIVSDNSSSISGNKGRCIQVDSLVGLTPNFSTPPVQISDCIKISECELKCGIGTDLSCIALVGIPIGFSGSIIDYPIYNVIVKNNVCISPVLGMIFQFVNQYEAICNDITCVDIGISLQTSSDGIVKYNKIRGTGKFVGISESAYISAYPSKHNLIKNNFIKLI